MVWATPFSDLMPVIPVDAGQCVVLETGFGPNGGTMVRWKELGQPRFWSISACIHCGFMPGDRCPKKFLHGRVLPDYRSLVPRVMLRGLGLLRCERCYEPIKLLADVYEGKSPCGCVRPYCARCWHGPLPKPEYVPTAQWITSLSKVHEYAGGTYHGHSLFRCPTHYRHPIVVVFERTASVERKARGLAR